ncbi:MAG: pyruvate kinase alpha/beta domain-containing protein [Candidatus Bathyarchaeia archaeon]
MSYRDKVVRYFDEPGPQNTVATLEAVKDRMKAIGIKHLVVASTYGSTALKAIDMFRDMDVEIVVVTISRSFEKEGWVMDDDVRRRIESLGAKVLTCTHALGDDLDSAFTEKFGGRSYKQIVADTLRRFSQGMKVAVEIILMAADAGLIPVDRDVAAVAGTDRGADTAIIAKPSYSRRFLEFKIKEIVAMPAAS